MLCVCTNGQTETNRHDTDTDTDTTRHEQKSSRASNPHSHTSLLSRGFNSAEKLGEQTRTDKLAQTLTDKPCSRAVYDEQPEPTNPGARVRSTTTKKICFLGTIFTACT